MHVQFLNEAAVHRPRASARTAGLRRVL